MIIGALRNSRSPRLAQRAANIDGCCRTPAIFEGDDGRPVLVLGCCRDRLCPRCQYARAKDTAKRIAHMVRAMNAPRFATLTLTNDGRGLKHRREHLASSFRRLRKDPWFKRHCKGGVYAIQTTRGDDGQHWHIHLHLIFDGEYTPQDQLSKAWATASGGSIIVDIRAVHDRAQTARYIAQYVSKPFNMRSWAPEKIREYAIAMHGARLLHTFGSLHGQEPAPSEPPTGARPKRFLCHASQLTHFAKAGNELAARAREICSRLSPLWASAVGMKHHATANGLQPVEQWELELVSEVARQLNARCYGEPEPPPDATPPAYAQPLTPAPRDQLALAQW